MALTVRTTQPKKHDGIQIVTGMMQKRTTTNTSWSTEIRKWNALVMPPAIEKG